MTTETRLRRKVIDKSCTESMLDVRWIEFKDRDDTVAEQINDFARTTTWTSHSGALPCCDSRAIRVTRRDRSGALVRALQAR